MDLVTIFSQFSYGVNSCGGTQWLLVPFYGSLYGSITVPDKGINNENS